jgi:DNA-binding NtrC family response regulator
MKARVLLVEGDEDRGRALVGALSVCCECRLATTVEQVQAALDKGRWDALVVNAQLGDGSSGLEMLQMARETLPQVFRLLYNSRPSASFLHDAERLLAPHFVGHSGEPGFAETLRRELERLLDTGANEPRPELPAAAHEWLVACAPASQRFARALCTAAAEDGPIYVYGEPGTCVAQAGALLRQMRRERRAGASPRTAGTEGPVRVLRVPPLRECPQDIPELAERFLLDLVRHSGGPVRRLSARARDELLVRAWFGNTRELAAVLARAVHRAGNRTVIEAEDLPRDTNPAWRPSQYAKDEGQRDCVLRQLRLAHNVSAAARREGCSRANYIRLMRRLGIIRADLAVERPAPETAGA